MKEQPPSLKYERIASRKYRVTLGREFMGHITRGRKRAWFAFTPEGAEVTPSFGEETRTDALYYLLNRRATP